jgi:beta-N-acetylhexosaminidase
VRGERAPLAGALLAACASATLAAGCGSSGSAPRHIPSERARLVTQVRHLTTSQLAGQRIVYAYDGLTPPRSLLRRIRRGEAAGVIFFGVNINGRARLRATVQRLERANRQSPVDAPLLFMTDQEGGLVRRLPGAPDASEKRIGESAGAEAAAREAGTEAAANLHAAGINVNLAPVLDVYRRTGDFDDQFERSYSSDPARAGALGAAFVDAQQAAGVAATAKHFPGLGAAGSEQNTDVAPVALDVPLATLRSTDERPFFSAIAAGVKLVMLSWATYPALDPRRPAGFSPAALAELRGRLHFRGVTITDSLGAGAAAAVGSFSRRAKLAAQAGEDLILCSAQGPADGTPADGVAALRSIAAAISANELPRAGADEAAVRVLELRRALS